MGMMDGFKEALNRRQDNLSFLQAIADIDFPVETQLLLMTGDISKIEELKCKDHEEFEQKILDGEIEIFPSLHFGYNFTQLKLVANRQNKNLIWHSLWTMPFLLIFYVVFVAWYTGNWFHLFGLLIFPLGLIASHKAFSGIFSLVFIGLASYFIYTGKYSLLNICGYFALSCAIAGNLRKITRDIIRESALESVTKLVYLYVMNFIVFIHSTKAEEK
jgi:sensor histidine kinase YesM